MQIRIRNIFYLATILVCMIDAQAKDVNYSNNLNRHLDKSVKDRVFSRDNTVVKWLMVGKNDYKKRPFAGFSAAYGLSLLEPPKFYNTYQPVNNTVGHQATLEIWIKLVDRPYFFASLDAGATIHSYSGGNSMSSMIVDGKLLKLDQILYFRSLVGVNVTPGFNIYMGIGLAGLYMIPDIIEKHVIISIGAEWRISGRLGIKTEYNFIPNQYANVFAGSAGTHFFNFGLNIYLL